MFHMHLASAMQEGMFWAQSILSTVMRNLMENLGNWFIYSVKLESGDSKQMMTCVAAGEAAWLYFLI